MDFIKNNRGVSLVGLLGTALISSIVIAATLRVAVMATRSSQVEQNALVEGVLKTLISKKILISEEQCKENFKASASSLNTNPNKDVSISELKWYHGSSGSSALLKTGWFKNQLNIVKMKLENYDATEKSVIFSVYYKKKGLGNLNTVKGGKNCNSGNQTDCYFYQCEMTNFVLNTTTNTVTSCDFEKKCSD